ncbi:MAG: PAS domain S-box protein [Thermodesulfobacteriota bacterium]
MTNNHPAGKSEPMTSSGNRSILYSGLIATFAALVIAGILFGWETVRQTDREMRERLLLQARLAAAMVDMEQVRSLSGTGADLENPAYMRLKRQFASVRQAHDQCRFVYLMGRGPDGKIFIFVDNEPPDSSDYSPPGQIYDEASAGFHGVFLGSGESVEGPVSDRWGSWVSALIPLREPDTGALVAVFGLDIDARDWQRMVLSSAVMPMGMTAVLIILLAMSYALAFSRRRALDHQEKLQENREILARLSDETEKQRRLMESLLDAIPAPVFFKDRNGDYLGCNPAFEKITGVTKTDIIGKKPHDLWPEQFSSTYIDRDMELLAAGGRQQYEFQYPGADGSERDVIFYKSTFIDAKGEIDGIVGVMLDITERKKAEEQLRRLKLAVEQTIDGLAVADLDGKVVFTNKAWADMHGYDTADLVGRHLGIFHTEEQMREHVRPFNEKVRIAGSFHGEVGHVRKDGSVFLTWMSTALMHDEQMQPVGLVAVARDISEQKKTEEELIRLRLAIDQVGDMIVITDTQGIIQYVNPAFEQVTGYGRREAVGQNPRIMKSGRQDQVFYENLWATITSGRTWQGRMINRRKDGTFFTEDATISPVHDAAGRIVNFVAVKRDITEHIRLTTQLQHSQKMETVGRLAGGVAHDFNNMLNVIIGHAEMADEGLAPDDPFHQDIQEILGAARRSAEITRQLLAFARKQTITPEVLDLNAMVEGMLKMLRRITGEDIDLVWHPYPGLWPINIDPGQVDQIMANLMVNASEAITGAGRIIVETANMTPDETFCANYDGLVPGDYVHLSISDNGRGMDQAMLVKLFEPFFTTKRVGEGSGLGLATVYGIVKQNNGYIYAESEPMTGTTFRIFLPRHTVQPGQHRAIASAEISPGRGAIVLIVEDEASILKLARRILERQGYMILTAGSTAEALALAEGHKPPIDLLITDVIMPGMNGRELFERLRLFHPDVQVLYMSGYTADIIGQRGVLTDEVHFIHKPFSNQDLVDKVKETLNA